MKQKQAVCVRNNKICSDYILSPFNIAIIQKQHNYDCAFALRLQGNKKVEMTIVEKNVNHKSGIIAFKKKIIHDLIKY